MKSCELALIEAGSVSMTRFQAFDDETGTKGILTTGEVSLGPIPGKARRKAF